MQREEDDLFGNKNRLEDFSSNLIDSYKHSKRTQRTSYSLNYGGGLFLYEDGLKESRVAGSWLQKQPTTIGSSVRDREGFAFERSPTFSYNDRFCVRRRNSRFDTSLPDLIASSKQSIIRFKKAISNKC